MTTTDVLPAGPRSPAAVQLLRWVFRPIPFLHACARRYGPCFTMRLPQNPPFVLFSTPEAVKEIFTGDPEQLPAGKTREILRPLVGQHSLLLLDGARHAQHRRLMAPSFHGERMRAYGQTIREITDRQLDTWPTGRPFPLHPCMQEITLDVILRTVFGLDEGAEQGRLRHCLAELLRLGANPIRLIAVPWLQRLVGFVTNGQQIVQLLQEIDTLLYAQIAHRRQHGGAGREDILSLLVEARDEAGQPMSDEELRDEMVTMLIAGHETTATSLAWTFHCILDRPEVLDRLRAELGTAAGSGPGEPQPSHPEPSPAGRQDGMAPRHLPQLDYLDATIREAQRLYPILPLVGRVLPKPIRLGGQDLPAGVVVAPCIYLTHHHPDIWPEPHTFDPGRFLAKRVSPYEFFPFGGGIRHCIGAAFALYEMKIVLAQVLSRASLRPAPGRRVRLVRRGITFAPSQGMPVVCDALAA